MNSTPSALGIIGTSNGGLLVGAALTERPDLYRAVLCGFPDVDILRFNQFTTNNNMPALLEHGHAANRGLTFSRRIEDTAAELTFMMRELGLSAISATSTDASR